MPDPRLLWVVAMGGCHAWLPWVDADWCLQSDLMTNLRLQAAPRPWSSWTGSAAGTRNDFDSNLVVVAVVAVVAVGGGWWVGGGPLGTMTQHEQFGPPFIYISSVASTNAVTAVPCRGVCITLLQHRWTGHC